MNSRIEHEHCVCLSHFLTLGSQVFGTDCCITLCVLLLSRVIDSIIEAPLLRFIPLNTQGGLLSYLLPLIVVLLFILGFLDLGIKFIGFPFDQFLVFLPLDIPLLNVHISDLKRHNSIHQYKKGMWSILIRYNFLELIDFPELQIDSNFPILLIGQLPPVFKEPKVFDHLNYFVKLVSITLKFTQDLSNFKQFGSFQVV